MLYFRKAPNGEGVSRGANFKRNMGKGLDTSLSFLEERVIKIHGFP